MCAEVRTIALCAALRSLSAVTRARKSSATNTCRSPAEASARNTRHPKAYMGTRGPFWLERQIRAASRAIWASEERDACISRESLGRFLEASKGVGVSDDKLWVIYRFLVWEKQIDDPSQQFARSGDPFFAAWCDQCGFDQGRVDATGSEYGGLFPFYAWSEDYKDMPEPYVIRGAMRFFRDERAGTLSIEETQVSQDGTEVWRGYFLESQLMCAIIAHRPELKIPKTYILGPGRFAKGSRQVTELTGRMLKVGDKGGFFASGVFMRRDNDALKKCNTLEVSKIAQEEKPNIDRIGPRH